MAIMKWLAREWRFERYIWSQMRSTASAFWPITSGRSVPNKTGSASLSTMP